MIGRLKTAEEAKTQTKGELAKRNHAVLKSIGAGALGLGVGTLAGYAGTKGIDALLRRNNGKGIPPGVLRWAAPIAVGGLGMATSSWRAHQQEMMRRADKDK